jgi:hypothetical protein
MKNYRTSGDHNNPPNIQDLRREREREREDGAAGTKSEEQVDRL